MRTLSNIAPDLTVRQVATAWPSCSILLERYPGARCDGRWTLQELAAFARDHGLQEQRFLEELASAAAAPIAESGKPAEGASPVPLIFMATAVCLTLGAGWGVSLLLRIAWGIDYGVVSGASVHVHGVAQLWGWMALFVFAVATHLLRQNTRRPAPPWLEHMAAGLIIAGLLVFFAGLVEPLRSAVPRINVIASASLAGAAILFGISVIWSLTGRAKSQRTHGFVFLIGWLWAWAGADLWLRLHYASAPVLPDSARRLLIILPVLGFATNAIYGFGIRLIPGLLNIGRLRPRFFSASMMMHNAGLCLLLVPPRIVRVTGAALMLGASVLYLIGMNGLRSKPARPIHGVDVRGRILVRVAFFWLICGLSMIVIEQLFPALPHAYGGAWRHALTVGFITTMILGVGQRIVPIFIKQPLASTQMMLVSAALIIAGNAGRVGLELATIGGWPWTFRLMGATGILELSALMLFALNLALTVRNHRHIYRGSEPLTPDVRVREAVNACPELQCRLRQAGITMFDDVPFIAPSMTFGALSLANGRTPEDLLGAIGAGECRSAAAADPEEASLSANHEPPPLVGVYPNGPARAPSPPREFVRRSE